MTAANDTFRGSTMLLQLIPEQFAKNTLSLWLN